MDVRATIDLDFYGTLYGSLKKLTLNGLEKTDRELSRALKRFAAATPRIVTVAKRVTTRSDKTP